MGLDETRIFEVHFSDLTYESQDRYLRVLGYSKDDVDNMCAPIAVVMRDMSDNFDRDMDPEDVGREITKFNEDELKG